VSYIEAFSYAFVSGVAAIGVVGLAALSLFVIFLAVSFGVAVVRRFL
jgi:hypothetical protein